MTEASVSRVSAEAAVPSASPDDEPLAWLNDLTRLQPWWDSHAFLPAALQAELAAAVLSHVQEAGARQWLLSVQPVQPVQPVQTVQTPDLQAWPMGVVLRQALVDFARQRPRLALAAVLALAVMVFKIGRAVRAWVA